MALFITIRAMQNELLEKALELRSVLTRLAVGEDVVEDSDLYVSLRNDFYSDKFTKKLLPDFVLSSRILSDFWPYIKRAFNTYADRREFIREQFEPLCAYLEEERAFFYDDVVNDSITKFDCDTVIRMWTKALERRESDPDGAITVARSLVECVCKQILTERDVAYEHNFDLPKLFKTTARCLQLAPELYNEEVFKQILSGMQRTIDGFAALRNGLSDAHGQPKGGYRANRRHAELAVNLAGATASFLIQTHQDIPIKSMSN